MIQAIVFALVVVWLAWGLVNVIWGFVQIVGGLACGAAAVVLYTLGVTLELVGKIFRR